MSERKAEDPPVWFIILVLTVIGVPALVLAVIALALFLCGVVVWAALVLPFTIGRKTMTAPVDIMAYGHLPVRDHRVS